MDIATATATLLLLLLPKSSFGHRAAATASIEGVFIVATGSTSARSAVVFITAAAAAATAVVALGLSAAVVPLGGPGVVWVDCELPRGALEEAPAHEGDRKSEGPEGAQVVLVPEAVAQPGREGPHRGADAAPRVVPRALAGVDADLRQEGVVVDLHEGQHRVVHAEVQREVDAVQPQGGAPG